MLEFVFVASLFALKYQGPALSALFQLPPTLTIRHGLPYPIFVVAVLLT